MATEGIESKTFSELSKKYNLTISSIRLLIDGTCIDDAKYKTLKTKLDQDKSQTLILRFAPLWGGETLR